MAKAFGWDFMQRGLVISAFAYGYILTQLPSGALAARFTPLRVLFVAVLGWSLATALTPLAAHMGFGVLLIARVVMGTMEGFCLPAVFQLLCARIPAAQRARAFATVLSCGSVGQLLALLLCPLMANAQSWPLMFYLFGGSGLAWCAAATAGRAACASDESESPAASELRDTLIASSPPPPHVLSRDLVRQLACCQPLWAVCAAHFGQNWTNYLLAAWLPTYLHEQLGMPTAILGAAAVPFAANAVSGMVLGYIADGAVRRGTPTITVRRLATSVGLLGPAACHLAFMNVKSPTAAVAITTLSFILGAASCSGYMANHADLSTSYAGITFAVSNTIATVPGLTAGPLTAWLLQQTGGSWPAVFGLAATMNVVCTAIYWKLSRAHVVLSNETVKQ